MNNLQVINASRALPRGCASRATPTHVGPLMIWHMRARVAQGSGAGTTPDSPSKSSLIAAPVRRWRC